MFLLAFQHPKVLAMVTQSGSTLTVRALACPQRICCAQYDIPPALQLSAECVDLLSRILVAAPAQRISIAGICAHPWFLRNLPGDLQVSCHETGFIRAFSWFPASSEGVARFR